MSTPAPEVAAPDRQTAAGKYLTFVLGRESYGIAVLKIREIIRMIEVTRVPRMPEYVKGVINLRGKVIPVVDLRVMFGLGEAKDSERTCVVVVQIQLPSGARPFMGLVVDGVEEVINLGAADIEETPDFGASVNTEYILGMAKVKGAVKTLLDIDRVLAARTVEEISQAANA
ncbi:MAG TPA: chemotaxis protein CheW [Verrucomicrobiae bacterium]|nr:chemotaxis protein CheW [Verrucomicrobiae bacterium]